MPKKDARRVLVIGGQFAGTFVARDLRHHFHVTVVDAKEYFEYTPGVLRAFVKPAHLDSLTFTLQPVLERKMGVKFIWGEVLKLDGDNKTATVKTSFNEGTDTISFDFCIICSGCNFGPFKPQGESLWFPTVHARGREVSEWKHIDERFLEGRRRHVLEEYHKINDWCKKKANVLVVGAGFIGVEWITELEYFFADLETTIIDFLPRCLGPLPDAAAEYCSEYMHAAGIAEFYGKKYAPDDAEFWKSINLQKDKVDVQYICIGVKASNYFMPPETLSDKGPGGGGWIHMNRHMQVVRKPNKDDDEFFLGLETKKTSNGIEFVDQAAVEARRKAALWANGCVFAVGDCNYGCIPAEPRKFEGKQVEKPFDVAPIPKISYPGEEQALHAVKNLERMDANLFHGKNKKLLTTWWPWGAGMFATSLGPHDACFVLAANEQKCSGYMVNWWYPAALQKEIIETTKIDECKHGLVGRCIWHFVHHTPLHLFGRGPLNPWCA